ncbi:aldo/keto reductase [Streptomyces sp. PTM05]|uniref:Aldo/keto reductase n=1 Tax=Streptantibioticus parmotrematis TaxID=2873249 RepID=A0ABS7QKK3_9ACTN|nr:aldo/keto reductase [Streptantibioticus parmotrematis]MBY8883708.1 aldo/keto reductase [Streptantibioticus parmotrematis]
MNPDQRPALAAGRYALGGDLTVTRLGFGSKHLTGPGALGAPEDPAEAVRVLRRAADLGVTFIDTADCYGPMIAEQLIRKALHPYPDDLVIATKAGLTHPGPGQWHPVGRPEYLRRQVELSLRNLGLERIDLFQLHRIDPLVPLVDQIGALRLLQEEGKIRHVGLSEVSVEEVEAAARITPIVSVQNLYNLTDRTAEPLLDHATRHGIGFIPWFPLDTGRLTRRNGPLATLARRHGATPSQLALAWLLRRSPAMLPIPGTSRVAHLEENTRAAVIALSDTELATLTAMAV